MTYEEAFNELSNYERPYIKNGCKFYAIVVSENRAETDYFISNFDYRFWRKLIDHEIKVPSSDGNYRILGLCFTESYVVYDDAHIKDWR